jgi:hypothetical protein
MQLSIFFSFAFRERFALNRAL